MTTGAQLLPVAPKKKVGENFRVGASIPHMPSAIFLSEEQLLYSNFLSPVSAKMWGSAARAAQDTWGSLAGSGWKTRYQSGVKFQTIPPQYYQGNTINLLFFCRKAGYFVPRGRKKRTTQWYQICCSDPEKAKHVLLFATNKVSITCPASPPKKKSKKACQFLVTTPQQSRSAGGSSKGRKKRFQRKKNLGGKKRTFCYPSS